MPAGWLQESGLLPVLAGMMARFSPLYQPLGHAEDLVQCLTLTLAMYDR